MSGDSHPGDAWTAFGLGVFGGVIAGLTLLSFVGLQVFGILAIACTALIRPHAFAISGLLISIAVTWTTLMIQGATRCGEPPCGMDATLLVVPTALILVTGVGLLGIGVRRARRKPQPSS
jgi:hypothetical protein